MGPKKMQTDGTPGAHVLDEEGNAAASIFRTEDDCWTYVQSLVEDDRKGAADKRAQIARQKAGAPPWVNREVGLNLNWGEAEEALEDRMRPYVQRLNSERMPIEVEVWHDDPTYRDDLCRRISSAASHAWTSWDGAAVELLAALSNMGDYGMGVLVWTHDTDPEFEAVELGDAFFEARSTVEIDSHAAVVIRKRFTGRDLLDRLEVATSENPNGWKADALRDALASMRSASLNSWERSSWNPEQAEQERRSNYIGAQVADDHLECFVVAAINPSTMKVDQFIVAEHLVPQVDGSGQRQTKKVYLRHKESLYDRLSQFAALLPLNGACKRIHEARGHGHRIVPKAQASSRAKCQLYEAAAFRNHIWLRTGDQDSAMRSMMQTRGNYGFLDGGMEIIEVPSNMNYSDHMGVIGMAQNELRVGLPTTSPQQYSLAKQRASATAERAHLLEAATLSEAEASTFDRVMDRVVLEFYRRLATGSGGPVRAEFRRRLDRHGIERGYWTPSNVDSVRFRRSAGAGSRYNQIEIAQQIMAASAGFAPRGQHEAREAFISAVAGPDHVRRFVPEYDSINLPDNHHWVAEMENGMLGLGRPVPGALGSQHDEIHMRVHLAPAMQIAQSVAQLGGAPPPPQQAIQWASIMAPLVAHMETHMVRLDGDEATKPIHDRLMSPFSDARRTALHLAKVADQAQSQLQAAAQDLQQSGQQLSPEIMKARQKMAQDEAAHQLALQHKQQEHDQKMRMEADRGRIKAQEELAKSKSAQQPTNDTESSQRFP